MAELIELVNLLFYTIKEGEVKDSRIADAVMNIHPKNRNDFEYKLREIRGGQIPKYLKNVHPIKPYKPIEPRWF